ncbi:MAG: metallophosphoesterase family protein, partial [Bacteroidales bacterium]
MMRIGMLTDIHEDTEMLREALRLAEINRCDELVCLGDIVGHDRRFYKNIKNKSGKQCLNLIRTNCRYIVAGNHDLFAARRIPAYSERFRYTDHWFSMNSDERKLLSKGKVWSYEYDDPVDLDDEDLSFLKSLPEY